MTLGLAKWNSPLYNSIWVKVTCAQKKVHFSGTKSQCQYVHYQNIIITSLGLIMHNRMSLTPPPPLFVMQGLTHNVFLLPGLRDWHQWATMWVDEKDLSLVLEVKRGGMRNWLVPYEPSSEGCTNRGKCMCVHFITISWDQVTCSTVNESRLLRKIPPLHLP